VLAPTGTIGLLMDCDTTGVEPDFALTQVQEARRRRQLQDREPVGAAGAEEARVQRGAGAGHRRLRPGTATLKRVAEFSPASSSRGGLLQAEIAKVEKSLESVFDLRAAFAPHVIGPAALQRLGLEAGSKGKQVLAKLGYTDEQIDAATLVVCGRQTVEARRSSSPSITQSSTARTAAGRWGRATSSRWATCG